MAERNNSARQSAEKKRSNPGRKKGNPTQQRATRASRKAVKDAATRGSVGMDRVESPADRDQLRRRGAAAGTTSAQGERLNEGGRKMRTSPGARATSRNASGTTPRSRASTSTRSSGRGNSSNR